MTTRREPRPTLAARAVAAVFAALAAARRGPALHPVGETYDGELVITASSDRLRGVPLFRPGRRFRAVVRASRAAGLPAQVPDPLGLAVRLPRLARSPALDLLLTTSGRGPLGRRLPLPRRSFLGPHFSSLLPFRVGRSLLFLGARPVDGAGAGSVPDAPALGALRSAVRQGPVRYRLLVASRFGPWEPIGDLELIRLSRRRRRPHFNPWNTTPGLRPAGLVNRTRDLVYRASQRRAP